MPCEYYSRDELNSMERAKLKGELDKVTNFLCHVMKKLNGMAVHGCSPFSVPVEIWEWFDDHQRMDKKRKVDEKEKKEKSIKEHALNLEMMESDLKSLEERIKATRVKLKQLNEAS